jgi:hypothetical protein
MEKDIWAQDALGRYIFNSIDDQSRRLNEGAEDEILKKDSSGSYLYLGWLSMSRVDVWPRLNINAAINW